MEYQQSRLQELVVPRRRSQARGASAGTHLTADPRHHRRSPARPSRSARMSAPTLSKGDTLWYPKERCKVEVVAVDGEMLPGDVEGEQYVTIKLPSGTARETTASSLTSVGAEAMPPQALQGCTPVRAAAPVGVFQAPSCWCAAGGDQCEHGDSGGMTMTEASDESDTGRHLAWWRLVNFGGPQSCCGKACLSKIELGGHVSCHSGDAALQHDAAAQGRTCH